MSTSGYSWLSSALAKGCNYTLTLWSRLTRFLNYSQLDLSNNLVENAIRRLALRPATFFAVVVAAPAIPPCLGGKRKDSQGTWLGTAIPACARNHRKRMVMHQANPDGYRDQ
ncbi:MAG: transposase [Verrucomicrobia bacterium]|nr:transposase [Verrucomicrobiota bacterium]